MVSFNCFKGKSTKQKENKEHHSANGGYKSSPEYKAAKKKELNRDTMTPEQYAAKKKEIQDRMGPDHHYKSAAYARDKEEINGTTHGVEKIATHWGTMLGLGVAPVALSLYGMKGSGEEEQPQPDPTTNGTPQTYA